jgi:uncharacterized integral membrane protein
MIIFFIVGLLLGVFFVIFALQNIVLVTISFFSWHLTGSLALILLLTVTSGILIAILLLLPEFINNHFKYKNLKKENKDLTEELRKQKELTVFARKTPPTEEEILKIEHGVIDDKAY